ncbi:MAG: hypothetical protein ABI175_05855, partial [Polyangiales bacterium]
MRAWIAIACLAATCAIPLGCRKKPVDPGPDLAIVGESTRVRLEDPYPAQTPWLVNGTVEMVAARGERLGIQVLHRGPGSTSLTFASPEIRVAGFDVESYPVSRASTEMYGGGRTGTFADGLTPAQTVTTNPAVFEVTANAPAGTYLGELAIGDRKLPARIVVTAVELPPAFEDRVWAYEDPRELAWAA